MYIYDAYGWDLWRVYVRSHLARRVWIVNPVTSVIEVQYVMAPGTALVQKRFGGDGVTIVCGGDAGTAEGDFDSCLVWSTRPGQAVPILIVVENNRWGSSTSASSQHAGRHNILPGKGLVIPGESFVGNDTIRRYNP